MATITIASSTVEPAWHGGTPPRLRIFANIPFMTADGSPVQQGSPSSGLAYLDAACTLDEEGRVVVPEIELPSTTDSTAPNARPYTAYLYSLGADQSGQYSEFATFGAGFALDHTDLTQTWEDIRAFNDGTLPMNATDYSMSGDLDIGGGLDVGGSGTFGGALTAASLHITGGAQIDGAITSNDTLLVNDDAQINGIVTAQAFVGNGAGITGLTGATGGVANTGSTTIGADTNADGIGVIDFQIGLATKARLNNDGTFEAIGGLNVSGGAMALNGAYGAFTANSSHLQTFNQVNTGLGLTYPVYAGFIFDTPSNSGAQFGIVSKVNTGTSTQINRPAAHQALYKVAIYGECVTIPGNNSDSLCYGGNVLAEVNTGHLAFSWGFEIDHNNSMILKPDSYASQTVDPTFTGALHVATGGIYPTQVGIQTYALAGSEFNWAIDINRASYSRFGIAVGATNIFNTTTAAGGQAAELAIGHVNTRTALLIQENGATGALIKLRNAANNGDWGRVERDGTFLSITSSGGFTVLKDEAPGATRGFQMTATDTANLVGEDLLFNSIRDGVRTERLRLYNNDQAIVLGAAVVLGWGSGAPAAAYPDGSVYFRTGAGGMFYVRQSGVWTAK